MGTRHGSLGVLHRYESVLDHLWRRYMYVWSDSWFDTRQEIGPIRHVRMDPPVCAPEHGSGLRFLFTTPAGPINKLRIIEALELLFVAVYLMGMLELSKPQPIAPRSGP